MIIGEPLQRRHALLLYSPQPVKGTPVTPATAVGICNPTARMESGLVDLYGLGTPNALFFKPGEAVARLTVAITALQDAAFLIRGERVSNALPWNTIAIGIVDDAGTGYAWQLPDTKIGSMDVNCEAGGLLQATVELQSIGLLSEPTSLTPVQLTKTPLAWYEGVVTKDAAAFEARSFRISVNHNLEFRSVLYGVAPTANKRGPKYLKEGNEVVTLETVRYNRHSQNLQADTLTGFAFQAVFTDTAGGATPNTVTLAVAGAQPTEEEFAVGDDVLFRLSARGTSYNWTQTN